MTKSLPKQKSYTRVITAVLIGAVILLCLFFGNQSTISLFLCITILGAVELSRMTESSSSRMSTYIHVVLATLPILGMHLLGISSNLSIFNYSYLGLIILSCATMLIMIGNLWQDRKLPYSKARYLLTPLYWGLPFALAITYLKSSDENAYLAILGIILLLWTSDTMAYFTGRKFGKNKLMPAVSPGKTVEGSLGAGAFSILIGCVYAYALDQNMMKWIVIAIIVWVIGTLGDLVESKLKRTQGVKDSGNILPGHGGFLDRFDSLVMVIPFLLLLEYLSR